jgi:iron complex transport system permease protein
VALVITMVISLSLGSMPIPISKVVVILLDAIGIGTEEFTRIEHGTILMVRLPRILLGALVGAGLAISGATMQGLVRNGLADPGLIGVSSGAALGAASAIVVFGTELSALGLWAVPIAGTLGAGGCTYLVYRLGTRGGTTDPATLLLAGIAINALSFGIVGILIDVADDAELRTLMGWTLGAVSGATWSTVITCAVALLIGLPLALRLSSPLNALILGHREAALLGVDVSATARMVIITSAILVGVGTSFAGVIGFVGLVIPHLVRLGLGPEHKTLLPASAVSGALLVVLADLTARLAIAPRELPLGVLTSLLGAPFFLWLLRRREY